MPRPARYFLIENLLIVFASMIFFFSLGLIGTVRGLTRRTGLEWFNNIYTHLGLNCPKGSIVEIGIVTVKFLLFDDHPLILQKNLQLLGFVDAERMADGGIAVLELPNKR